MLNKLKIDVTIRISVKGHDVFIITGRHLIFITLAMLLENQLHIIDVAYQMIRLLNIQG